MEKQCLTWKPVKCKDIRGGDYSCLFPEIISGYYRGNLVESILNMPKKNVISFERAVQLTEKAAYGILDTGDVKKYGWYLRNFVKFISDSGFHIELSGDEFVFHLADAEV